jgi:hypothetical protein
MRPVRDHVSAAALSNDDLLKSMSVRKRDGTQAPILPRAAREVSGHGGRPRTSSGARKQGEQDTRVAGAGRTVARPAAREIRSDP